MAVYASSFSLASHRDNLKGKREISTITFVNDAGPMDVFTVTGDVIVRLIAICKTSITSAGAGNIECGVSGDTDIFIATTVGTAIDVNEIWHDATPDAATELESVSSDIIISNGDDVILTMSAQIDTGAIQFTAFWIPLSADGNVVAA